jgi:hypothetical protein
MSMELNIERRDSGPGHMAGFSSRVDFLLTQQEAEDRAAADAHRDLLNVIAKGDANAICTFAPTPDWARTERPLTITSVKHFRAMTLAEVLTQAMDMNGAPSMTELVQLLLNARSSTDADLALVAGDFVDALAVTWANNNGTGVVS